jgi:hypothetical protein
MELWTGVIWKTGACARTTDGNKADAIRQTMPSFMDNFLPDSLREYPSFKVAPAQLARLLGHGVYQYTVVPVSPHN